MIQFFQKMGHCKIQFSDVFRVYGKRPMAWHGLSVCSNFIQFTKCSSFFASHVSST